MKRNPRIESDIHVKGPLGERGGSSFLACERGKERRPRWVLRWLTRRGLESLQAELRTDFGDLCSLSHPSLVLPVSFGTDPETGRPFLLRRYVEGSDISVALRVKSPPELASWLCATAEALGVLHCAGFAHGNLKASNLVVPQGALLPRAHRGPRVVLCDPDLTTHASSPDAFALDLRSLGAVFYRLLTGKPVDASSDGFPRSPSEVQPTVPRDLERIVLKLLHPDSEKGYRNASSLIRDLRVLSGKKSIAPWPAPECFVGRRAELSSALRRLADPGKPAAIAVRGDAGMGKTAFLRRLALDAGARGHRVVLVRCYLEALSPFEPLRAMARELIPRGATGRALRAKYRSIFPERAAKDDTALQDSSGRRAFVKSMRDFILQAATRPVLLLVDDAHLADPLTVELLAAIARGIESAAASGALSLVASFRDESQFREAVKPLHDVFKQEDERLATIRLEPMAVDEVNAWLEKALPEEEDAREGIKRGVGLRAQPFAIREAIVAARGGSSGASEPASGRTETLTAGERTVLDVVGVLGRPAPCSLLSLVLRSPEQKIRSVLDSLVRRGTLSEERGEYFFRRGSVHLSFLDAMPLAEKQRLHRELAVALERHEKRSVREVAHHWLESDEKRRGVAAALSAARELVRSHQDRTSLRFYGAVLSLIPHGTLRWRAIAAETADACMRAGQHSRGAEVVASLLADSKGGPEAGRWHSRLGVLCHRMGQTVQAKKHLEEALRHMAGSSRASRKRERLWTQAELAEIAVNEGDYALAESICRRALEDLATLRNVHEQAGVHWVEMILLGTLAHSKLRRFEYRESLELFAKSLAVGEGLEHVPERSLILNNLGTLHTQENRFFEAIDCFERAEEISARLEDDLSLAVLSANLAMLYARTGNKTAAVEAMRRAARHEGRCGSLKIRFLRLHSAGVAEVALGRYEEGVQVLEAAVTLGDELKDAHLTAFDFVYLGECQLFRGEWRAAREAFDRALAIGARAPLPVGSMVEARRAALAALRRESRIAKASLSAYAEQPPHAIQHVEAWNSVFLGWAHRLLGEHDAAMSKLERAVAFFSTSRATGGEIHAQLELAMVDADRGMVNGGTKRIDALRARFAVGEGPLANPMLAARLLLYQTKLCLERKPPAVREAAALLVEAESFLIGRSIRDLEILARDLRARLRISGGDRLPAPAAAPPEHLDATPGGAFKASGIFGQSPAIRKVIVLIRQMAAASLPVLITGETGSGKELVARAIHGESQRRAGPFRSLSCAAVPAELLEAELFGYVQGAFTGAEANHSGLIASAGGGVFLFDEVGEMPLDLQVKLLRALDRGCIRPVGSAEEVETDVRFLFATHRNLSALAEEGKFRKDLLFRLGAFEVRVPPLRERVEDIPLLSERFRAEAVGDGGSVYFDEGALQALASHSWPGNVRELRNVVFRLVLTRTERITAEDVKLYLGKPKDARLFLPEVLRGRPIEDLVEQLEREHLLQLHADRGGDLESMAKAMGKSVRALYDRFKRLGMKPGDLK